MGLTLDPTNHAGIALQPLVQGILDKVSLCAISSVNADGSAHGNTAFFCADAEWRLYFVSSQDARHSGNFGARPTVSVVVYDSRQDWDDWKSGLQLFGTCAAVHGPDTKTAANLYKRRFPAYGRWLHSVGRAMGLGNLPGFFRFEPDSLKLLCEERLGEEVFVTVRLTRS